MKKKMWHIYTMVHFPSRKKTENENWNLKNGNDKNDIKWSDWGPETCTLHGFSHMCIPSPNLLLYVFNLEHKSRPGDHLGAFRGAY